MRRIHDAKDVIPRYQTEPGPRALQIVDGLAHVAFCAEDERCDAVFCVRNFFDIDDLHDSCGDLRVCKSGVAEDGAPGLQRFDDLLGLIAGEGEAGGGGVDFHSAAEGLLGAGCHARGEGRGGKLVFFGCVKRGERGVRREDSFGVEL